MKITLTQYGVKHSVETGNEDANLSEVVRDLVKPLLIGAGFAASSVDACVDEDAVPNTSYVPPPHAFVPQTGHFSRPVGINAQ